MIHLWWHATPVPTEVENNRRRWEDLDTDVRLWGPDDLVELTERVAATNGDVVEPDRLRHAANVARWALLASHGGVWADTDVTPLRPLGSYAARSRPWCAGFGSLPTPFMCGGPAGHPLWTRMVDACLDHPSGTSPRERGPVAATHRPSR